MTDCRICDAKMKYNGKAYCKTSHGYKHQGEMRRFQHTVRKNLHHLN